MPETTNDSGLIACCGLYCGACGAYLRKKCPGCRDNIRATWCGVRKCCGLRHLRSCADCTTHANLYDCTALNNSISKVIGFLTNSSRVRSVKRLKELGPEGYARFMSEQGLKGVKKNG